MNDLKKLLKSPIFLSLAVLILILTYIYANDYAYRIGEEIGRELIVMFNEGNSQN